MSNRITYTHRRNALEPEKTVEIDGDALVLREGAAAERRVPLVNIERIRIAFEPTRVQDTLYTCRIWIKGRSSPFTVLHSQSYRGFADFEPHDLAYRGFVEALNAAVAERNPGAKFEAGASSWGYAANIGVLVLGAMALAWVLLLTGGEGWSAITITKALLILAMIPLGIAWVRANRPRSYDPRAIPTNVMPTAS